MATSTENPDSRQAPAPWWHDTKVVTFITALIAAVVPGTTAIQAYIEKQQSIELGRINANHAIRMDYVNKALTQNLTEDEQERVFSLLAKIKDDPILESWAAERLKMAQEKKEALAKESRELAPKADALESRQDQLGREVLSLKAAKAPQVQLAAKQSELDEVERRLQQIQARQVDVSSRIGEATAASSRETWFAVVASEYDWNAAVAKANSVRARGLQYPVEVYRATDDKARPVFAVTIGGYLPQDEAATRARFARDSGIASDAFAHQTTRWGMNLLPP